MFDTAQTDYLFLCLFFLSLFLRLCVFIFARLRFFPLGIMKYYLCLDYFVFFFTASTKSLQGLKAGILWALIVMVWFLEILRAVFSALCFTMKLPKPLKYTFSPVTMVFFHRFHESLNDSLNAVFFITGAVGNFINNFCFSHNLNVFLKFVTIKFVYKSFDFFGLQKYNNFFIIQHL